MMRDAVQAALIVIVVLFLILINCNYERIDDLETRVNALEESAPEVLR